MICIGEEVKRIRSEQKLTQEQFASRIHASQAKIARMESDTQAIDLDVVLKIAEEFQDYIILIKWHERAVNKLIKALIHCKNKIQK